MRNTLNQRFQPNDRPTGNEGKLLGELRVFRDTSAKRRLNRLLALLVGLLCINQAAAELTQTLVRIRPSVVGIGTYQPARNPALSFRGTGFVVADGRHIVTNAHVLPPFLDPQRKERLVALIGRGSDAKPREVERIAQDAEHDLALLRIKGEAIPGLKLAESSTVQEGQAIAFTGFPIGTILGLYPVTHKGIVAALTPIVIPGDSTEQLDAKAIARLRKPFEVFQLDATAYPGNSGSPVYDPQTGLVIGIINMVFVKGTKEKAITEPSGITYAIPSVHIRDLLLRAKLTP